MSSRLFSSSLKLVLPGVVLPLLLQACGGVESGVPEGEFVPPVVEFQLVFEDNFDGETLDASKWNIDEGDGCPDLCNWGNNELQTYSPDNVSVSNGILRIEGRRETDGSYTSGRLNTKGKFDFRYGRIEVSARIPSGEGTWPAIWLLHSDPTIYGPWPLSGEIDIMEALDYGVDGNQSTKSTAHYGLPTPPFNGTGSSTDLSVNADTSFHEYALEWERGRLRFFVDGQHFQTQIVDEYWVYYPAGEDGLYDPYGPYTLGLEDAPFDQAFHLLLNFAIGGNPVGDPDGTPFPQAMEVDYVRIYECANSNPQSRRGCGTADPSVEVLSDHDGGPLEGANTAKPYVESVNLFLDGPETITLEVGDLSGSNTLEVDGFTGDGAVVVSNPAAADPDDPENIVWQVGISGGIANVYLKSQNLADDELLDTGFDLSGSGLGGDPVGEIVFDMYVNSISDDATILIKLDSGFPDLGEVVLPASEIVVGEWKTYSIKFQDLVANPGGQCCGGVGVDLENVVNPFVFEVTTGSVDVLLDNIHVTNACYVVGACTASLRTKGIPDLIVFDDAVNIATWSRGINASDSGTGFTDYSDGTNPANKVNWAIITDDDPARGQVIDVTFNDSSAFGVWFIADATGVNTSAFAAGAVVFDIIVDDYGTNTAGMTMKIDCFITIDNCTSKDKNLGVIADGVWETVTVRVSDLTATGLDLTKVNTGLVVFPTAQNNTGTARFRLDNIRWVADTDKLPKEQIDLPVTFDDPLVDYTVDDFEGAQTTLVEDPADSSNTVAQTVKAVGAATFAGTTIGTDAGFANPIPFAAGDTSMSVDVYSPAADVPILLKVENADKSVAAEVLMNTTSANTWETITFDFSTAGIDTSATFVRAIIFFDFGQDGAGDTYLWDNVRFGSGATGGPFPVFDDGVVDAAWDTGIQGTDGSIGFASSTNPADLPLLDWAVVTAADPARGQVLQATIGGGAGANQFGLLAFKSSTADVDLSSYSGGAVVFDVLVLDYGTGTNGMTMKIDCGFPCTSNDQQLGVVGDGVWETVSVPVSQLVGGGLDLATVDTGLVIWPNAADQQSGAVVTFQVDNVRWEPQVIDEFLVLDNGVPTAAFDVGIQGTDGSIGFASSTIPAELPLLDWSVVASGDPARGDVLQATIGGGAGADQFGLLAIKRSTADLDLGDYDQGAVVFDIQVLDYGTGVNGMTMKIDCGFPCTSNDRQLGVVGDGAWQTVSVEVSQLVGGGLELTAVDTGLVIWPNAADQQSGAVVTFQLDNVHWEP